MANQINRILRNYRNLKPTKFHIFNQRVSTALTDNTTIPQSVWGANPTLLQTYLTTSQKHDAIYHRALLCSKLDISERDILQAQLVNHLDQIAHFLEAAAVNNGQIIIGSGFDLAKERRIRSRTKAAATDSEVSTTEEEERPR